MRKLDKNFYPFVEQAETISAGKLTAVAASSIRAMATTVEPFSCVMAELSERYTDEFPHPGIVPKYLETVSDKTGVQIVSRDASLAIKGSWLSLSRARSFLAEFLATYQKEERNDLSDSVDNDGERPKRNRTARKRRYNSSDADDIDVDEAYEPYHPRTLPADVKMGNDGVSSWLKFTAEVLPRIQRTRSKRAKVYSKAKDKSQEVPEPFVMVADFEPPSAPVGKKVPELDDIARVLKKVYQKDSSDSPTSAGTQDSMNADGKSGEKSTEHKVLQCSGAEAAVNPLSSIPPMTCLSGGSYGASSVNNAADAQGIVQEYSIDQPVVSGENSTASALHDHDQALLAQPADADLSSLVGPSIQPCGAQPEAKLAIESDAVVQDSASLTNTASDTLGNACEQNEEKVEPENSIAQDIVANEKPLTVEPVSNLSSSDADIGTVAQNSEAHSHRTSQRKGCPKKKEKQKEKKTVEKHELKSVRAECAARRNKTSQKLGGIPETRRQTRCATEEKPENTPNKPKRGRPAKPKSDIEGQTDYQCSKCSYVAKKRSHLREHMRRVHITKEFSCDKCGKVFGFGKDLKRHQRTHQETDNRCDICGKVYKGSRSLAEHKKIHAEDYKKPEFPCEFCDKIFSTKYVLAYHIKSEHLGMKKTYICPTCGKSFSQKNSYLQHANVHMGIRPHQCHICGKSFSYEKSLKEHKYMHEEGKQFECPICHKKFRQTSGMSIHMKIHKENKDYVCSACGKGFSQRQALVRHERIHGGEKPFACGLCQRTFTDSSILRRHMILIHKKDPKKWREDTVSSVKKRTDFFISVVGKDGETVRNDTTAEHGEKLLNPSSPKPPSTQLSEGHGLSTQLCGRRRGVSRVNHTSDSVIYIDDAESDGVKNELSVSFAPVGLQTEPLQVPASILRMHTEGLNAFTQGDSPVVSISVPSMTTDNLSQSLVLSHSLVSDEPAVSHPVPISFLHLSSLRTQQSGEGQSSEGQLTRSADTSSQGQAEIASQEDSQTQAQSPGLISLYVDHHRLNASDLFSSDSEHSIHVPYHSLLHPATSVSGTVHPPVISSLLQNSLSALSFHSEPLLALTSASQAHEPPSGFEQLAGQNAVEQSQYSPHNQNHQ